MKSFYVTVTSSEHCDFYRNTVCDFKNYLPTPICGKFEVALCSLIYTHSSYICSRGTTLGITPNRELNSESVLYTPSDLLKQIEKFEKEDNVSLSSVMWTPIVTSFVNIVNNKLKLVKDKYFDLTVSELNVFSSNIENERFGSEMKPILRSTTYASVKHETPVLKTFSILQYKKVCGNYLDSIHIYLRNELDQVLPIKSGRVTAVLCFRNL